MRGAATKAMSDIVEERQRSRCPPAAAPLRAAARRLAGFVARSSHTAPGIARRSRLASGPAAKCEVISARALRIEKRALLGAFYVNSAFPQACRARTCARPNIVFAQ